MKDKIKKQYLGGNRKLLKPHHVAGTESKE